MKTYIVIINKKRDTCRCFDITDRNYNDIIDGHNWVSIIPAQCKAEAISTAYNNYKDAISH